MNRLLIFICLSIVWILNISSGVFASSGDNRLSLSGGEIQKQEKQKAIEDVNTLIIESYRAQLDRILEELFVTISTATKGNANPQIEVLTQLRNDLDARLDALSDTKVSENRKKILLWIYFYLKSRIETRIDELRK